MVLARLVRFVAGSALFAMVSLISHNCYAQPNPIDDSIQAEPGYCLVRDSAVMCSEKVGVPWGIVDVCVGCDVEHEPCSGDSYAEPNPALTQEQYDKNRALSFTNEAQSGYQQAVSNSIECGVTGTCDLPCELRQEPGGATLNCYPITMSQTIVFYDLSGDCTPSP